MSTPRTAAGPAQPSPEPATPRWRNASTRVETPDGQFGTAAERLCPRILADHQDYTDCTLRADRCIIRHTTVHQPPRVLVVDDELPVLRLIRSILVRAGFEVKTAESGQEAFTMFQQDPDGTDLMLTDIVMPDLDGVALADRCIRIRQDLRVLFMTGYSAGAVAPIIKKPFTPEMLVRKVRDVFLLGCMA